MFSTVLKVEFDARRNLYLFDAVIGTFTPEELRVLIFSATGAFLREFGKMGDGPGPTGRSRPGREFRDEHGGAAGRGTFPVGATALPDDGQMGPGEKPNTWTANLTAARRKKKQPCRDD